LHIDSLQGKRSAKSVRQGLKTLPAGLDAAYTIAMSRIESQLDEEVETAKDVLSWISYATRPLTPLELQYALAIEDHQLFIDEDNIPDIEDLISICAGLVIVDEQSGVVRLVHYTVQEYFDRNRTSLFPNAHYQIATRCIHYLSFEVFNDALLLDISHSRHSLLGDNHLLEYAANSLRHHIHMQKIETSFILELLRRHVNVNVIFRAWIGFLSPFHPSEWLFPPSFYLPHLTPKSRPGIYLAACLDNVEAIKALLDDDEGDLVDIKDNDGLAPLLYAATYGSLAVVEFLLSRGVCPSQPQGEFAPWTPLDISIASDNLEMTDLLIGSGADINGINDRGVTPLGVAAEAGNDVLVRYLIERGAIADPRGPVYNSPLGLAAQKGHEAIFDYLAEGVDYNSFVSNYPDLLCCAALGGNKHIIARLLERDDIPVERKISYAQDALHGDSSWTDWPIHIAKDSALEILLALEGVDVNFKKNEKSLLHRCIDSQFRTEDTIATIKLLFQHGADPNIKNSSGEGCLVKASTVDPYESASTLDIMKLLVDTDNPRADLESKDQDGRTPLHCAVISSLSTSESEAMVQLLLEKGAEVDSRDSIGKTPFYYAVELY
jgi:ankyrin repeat protein